MFFVISLSLFSCGKEYTCECVDYNGIGGNPTYTTETYRGRNAADACSKGTLSWTSSTSTDHDGDGCRDSDEDTDDDGDGIADVSDDCPTVAGTSTLGEEGCPDDDGDGWSNNLDDCPTEAGNSSLGGKNACPDNDGDGCRDSDEDLDDDNDGLLDAVDLCPQGYVGWISNPSVDQDSDGCHDLIEDNDDDNDGCLDSDDDELVAEPFSIYICIDEGRIYSILEDDVKKACSKGMLYNIHVIVGNVKMQDHIAFFPLYLVPKE